LTVLQNEFTVPSEKLVNIFMSQRDPSIEIEKLATRIEAAKAAQAPKPRMDEHYSQAQLAWRMVIELVAGLGIGFGIGFGLDVLLGTQPWLMIIFLFFGLAAGIQTMMRSAREVHVKLEAGDHTTE